MSQKLIEEAESISATNPQRAQELYREVLEQPYVGECGTYGVQAHMLIEGFVQRVTLPP